MNHIEIVGTVKRIGVMAGPADATDIQFILEERKEVFVIKAVKYAGITQVGDKVSFIYNPKGLLMGSRNVEDFSFKNFTLLEE